MKRPSIKHQRNRDLTQIYTPHHQDQHLTSVLPLGSEQSINKLTNQALNSTPRTATAQGMLDSSKNWCGQCPELKKETGCWSGVGGPGVGDLVGSFPLEVSVSQSGNGGGG